MAIREKSFRIGCGRYLQDAGILSSIGEEIGGLGTAPLIVGGHTALSLTRDVIEQSVAASCERYLIVEHRGSCNDEDARALAELSSTEHYDVIVGVGGGVLMDFAKLVGYYSRLPVINVPTSTATCAAYTPLSVCYTPEGRTVGTRHFPYEVSAVIADTELLARQPKRLLLAGMFDALAKFVEIKHRFRAGAECPLGLDWAYMLSSRSYTELFEKTPTCLSDMEAGRVSPAVEQVIFTSLAVTGVISGIARGSNQTALAHKLYPCAVTPNGKLLCGGGTEGIGRGNDHALFLLFQLCGNLSDRGGFSHTVDTDHQNDRGLGCKLQGLVLTKHIAEVAVQKILDLGGILQPSVLHCLAKIFEDLLGGIHTEVGRDQKLLQLIKQILINFMKGLKKIVDLSDNGVFRLQKSVFQFLKEPHRVSPFAFLQFRKRSAQWPAKYRAAAS